MIDHDIFWVVTIILGIGTFLIRFSFLGFLGQKQLPDWMLLHLKYVGVAVFPALVTPMIIWPQATGGEFEFARLVGAVVALVVGMKISVTAAIVAGMGAFYVLKWI